VTETGAPKPLGGLRLFTWLLLLVSATLVAGGYLLWGIDFSLGVLLGSGIVVLSYLWSIRVFSNILGEAHSRARLGFSWVLKFGVTALVLYVAVVQMGMHPVGIMIGVSAVVIAGLLFAVVRRFR
jgi:hypothetical protein